MKRIIICLLCAMVMVSCSPERKLAKNYLENHKGNALLLVPANEIYKDNLTLDFDTTLVYSAAQLDSMAWAQSSFVKYLSDSVFLTIFTNAMIDELNKYNFDVYVENDADIFLGLSDPKWMINLAQIQLTEEYSYEYRSAYYMEDSYTIKFRKNKVNMSTWLEASRANSGAMQVLFLEGYLEDRILNQHTTNLFFDYNMAPERDSISMGDVYQMAKQSGVKHAELLFDYLMNDYIASNLPAAMTNRKFYHYDRMNKKLRKGLNERFDVVN